MTGTGSPVTAWLRRAPAGAFTAYAIGAAFAAYFCMYAFRKPFSAATYDGPGFEFAVLGFSMALSQKTAFVISQIIGYAVSKYLGIKVCSEARGAARAGLLVAFILAAELALLAFAVVPRSGRALAIFLNGLPLGMVWGLVVSYLEGRRTSELLLAGLSCSYIVASGVVKDVGRYLMREQGVPEAWMPFATGLLFLVPFLLAVWMLHQIPPPTDADEAERVHREPMGAADRAAFLRRVGPGLVLLLAVYFLLTAFRDVRDNYGVEVFKALGYGQAPAVFSQSELAVGFGVMAPLALLSLIRDNRGALIVTHLLMAAGLAMLGLGTLALESGAIGGLTWMILIGVGGYLAYVPFGSVLFDRMIASLRVSGTAVFAIYLADALGYTGSVAVQLYKDLGRADLDWLGFLKGFCYALAAGGAALMLGSMAYFARQSARPS